MRNLTIVLGPGYRIDVEDDEFMDRVVMVRIDGDRLKAAVEVSEGTVLEVGAEMRRLLDHAVEEGWVSLGKARYRKGVVTQWERLATEDRHRRQADEAGRPAAQRGAPSVG